MRGDPEKNWHEGFENFSSTTQKFGTHKVNETVYMRAFYGFVKKNKKNTISYVYNLMQKNVFSVIFSHVGWFWTDSLNARGSQM